MFRRWYCTLAAAMSCGCGQILDIPEKPQVVDASPWHCLNEAQEASPDPEQETAVVRVRTCSFLDNCVTAVSGITASLCGRRDVECAAPIATGIQDDDGLLEFEVQTGSRGFDGYLRVRAPVHDCYDEEFFGDDADYLCNLRPACDLDQPTTETCGISAIIPAMLFFNPPVRSNIEEAIEFQLMPTRGLPGIILAVGVFPPLDRGFMIVSVVDCNGRPAAGVRYTIKDAEDEVTVVYVESGVVSPEVTQTDDSGLGAIIGIPAGFARVAAYNEDQELVGEAGVLALPSALTYVTVIPE